MRIVRSSKTFDDIVEIATWLGADDPDVALRFYERYESSLEVICKTPLIGSQRRSTNGETFRIWFVSDFTNILIIYSVEVEEIRILRVIHSAKGL